MIGEHVHTLEYDKESIEHASNNPNSDWIWNFACAVVPNRNSYTMA